MPELSNRARTLQESAIRKLDLTVQKQVGVRFYRLNIGQPDVPTPEPMLAALHAWQPRVVAYGPASGLPDLRRAAAAYTARWSPGLEPQHVAVTAGGSEALLFAFTVICDPGDEILVPEPFYTNYTGFAQVAGAVVRPVRTRLEEGFAIPPDAELDLHLTDRTRAIVFSNPGNPTGAVYPRAELERVARWARSRGLFVVADEVYRRIWFGEEPPSALAIDDCRDTVVVVDSLSKTWSACGLRIGFLISRNEAFMEKVERLGQARLGPQPLAQVAAMAALALPESYYDELRRLYRGRVDALHDAVSALPGVSAPRPRGAFYSMVRLPVRDADDFARFLVTDFRDAGESVVVAPGPGFYADPSSGRDEVRLAAVTNEADLRRAVEILGRGLEAYAARR